MPRLRNSSSRRGDSLDGSIRGGVQQRRLPVEGRALHGGSEQQQGRHFGLAIALALARLGGGAVAEAEELLVQAREAAGEGVEVDEEVVEHGDCADGGGDVAVPEQLAAKFLRTCASAGPRLVVSRASRSHDLARAEQLVKDANAEDARLWPNISLRLQQMVTKLRRQALGPLGCRAGDEVGIRELLESLQETGDRQEPRAMVLIVRQLAHYGEGPKDPRQVVVHERGLPGACQQVHHLGGVALAFL
mmetsp:Transcript_55606/g.140972  ORF Transcript_55606/g.140972 Transcript_55606/m.140972 type:complete len:247 (-) Transcript_55606:540-1280(-)